MPWREWFYKNGPYTNYQEERMSAKITKFSTIRKKAVVAKRPAKIKATAIEKNQFLLWLYKHGFEDLDWGKDDISQYILTTTLSKHAAKLQNAEVGKEIQTVATRSALAVQEKLGTTKVLSLTKTSNLRELIAQASFLEQSLGMPNPEDDDYPHWHWPHPWPWWKKWIDLDILTEINISQGIFENAKYLTNAKIKMQIQKLAAKSLASASVQLTSCLSKSIRNL